MSNTLELATLAEDLPHATWVNLSNHPKPLTWPVQTVPKSPWASKSFLTKKYDVVIAVQPYRNLLIWAALIPATTHLFLEHGSLFSLNAESVFSGALRKTRQLLWSAAPALTPPGSGNDYTHIEKRLHQHISPTPRPVVTVIVPVYNRKNALEKTLAALTQQTYPGERFEVIVGDDGSHDQPESLLSQFKDDLRLRFVRQEDQGYRLAAIRTRCMAAADGEIIISLD